MKIIGEKIFARDAEGRLLSRIGTMFLRTPALVTERGVHALQRVLWLDTLNAERAAAGRPPLTEAEEACEMAESVDLIFTDDAVLIRPDPDRMDLAFRADEILQHHVSKRRIRYLNTHAAKVREALRARGENWRMARQPISQDDMERLVTGSVVAIDAEPIYYYNRLTGTRFLTAGSYLVVGRLEADAFRRQIREIVAGLNKRNRTGHPEVDLFPDSTPIDIRRSLAALKPDELDDAALRGACDRLALEWRMALPAELREEDVGNYAWRNQMCHAITRAPNDTNAEEQSLIAGISPEFYRQIEWLPGARIADGEVIFDPIYEEAARTQEPELLSLCDSRVKSFLFNTTRILGAVKYINIGRISRSLARHPVPGDRRGNVYVMQYLEDGAETPRVMMIRLQKWGVAERLDEGKDLLRAILESEEYSDYILDRRLMCRELGMNLPRRLSLEHFTERYRGSSAYKGISVRTAYFMRAYVPGVASDKVPLARYRNPAWAQRFASLMGEAAAVDMIVGRASSLTQELLFDGNYEVVVCGADGLPERIVVTDHAGSFVDYERDFAERTVRYAAFATRRREYVGTEYAAFARAYVAGFRQRLADVQSAYRQRRGSFDRLFSDRPYDTNGSGAYRWAQTLRLLDACDVDRTAEILAKAVGC